MTREEAIKIIESNCSCTDSKLREACAMFIPELRESEDERIRKRIVKFIDEQYPTHGNLKEVKDKMLAYLEKQKEQKLTEDWKETRKKECPFRKEDGCERYADVVCECTGNCSWVVDYPKLKEIQDRKEQKDRLAPIYGAYC